MRKYVGGLCGLFVVGLALLCLGCREAAITGLTTGITDGIAAVVEGWIEGAAAGVNPGGE